MLKSLLNALQVSAGACAAVLLLGGCGIQGLQDQYTADAAFGEDTKGRRVTMPGSMPTFDLLRDCMPADLVGGVCEVPTMVKHFSAIDGTNYALWRDRFQDYLLWRSDQQCERHKSGIIAIQSAGNFGLSTITTGASAIAAIAVPPAASILAAIAAISSGTKSAFNEDVYRQFVGPAVVRQINSDRDDMLAIIMARRGVAVGPKTPKVVTETVAAPGTTASERAEQKADAEVKKKLTKTAQENLTKAQAGDSDAQKKAKEAKDKYDADKTESLKTALDKANATAAQAATDLAVATDTLAAAQKAEKDAVIKVEKQFITTTTTIPQDGLYTVNYQGTRTPVSFAAYTVEAAIQDVERYQQRCSFVSGLASLVQPGTKFADTELGIRQRIANLLAQIERNNTLAKSLGSTNLAAQNLMQINVDITRQIMILQQKLATAPVSVQTE